MLTLYGIPRSRSLRVSWLLEEMQLPWFYHFVDMKHDEHRHHDFLSLNPAAKVPVLKDDEFVLCESTAICLYLAEHYDNDFIPPAATRLSALHHRWISYILSEIEPPLWNLAKHRFVLPEAQRLSGMEACAAFEFTKALNDAEAWLGNHEMLLGDQIKVADIILCHCLNWATNMELPLSGRFHDYQERLSARPALRLALSKELEGKALSHL